MTAPESTTSLHGPKQLGVAAGMSVALVATVVAFMAPIGSPLVVDRQTLWASASGLDAIWLLIAIGNLARYRFFSTADIDAAASSMGTPRAGRMQALVQNTLEQTVLASMAYAAWVAVTPATTSTALVARCALMFSVGRLLFFIGYGRGAPARALGFALTFYPTVGLLAFSLPRVVAYLLEALSRR